MSERSPDCSGVERRAAAPTAVEWLGRPTRLVGGSATVSGGPRHLGRLVAVWAERPLSLSLASVCGYYTEDEAIGCFLHLSTEMGGLVLTTKNPAISFFEPVKRS